MNFTGRHPNIIGMMVLLDFSASAPGLYSVMPGKNHAVIPATKHLMSAGCEHRSPGAV